MQKKIIILVDDNPTTLFYNNDILSEIYPDKELFSYETSSLFLNDYLEGKFENCEDILVLLDINMPEYSGFDVLSEIEDEVENLDNLRVILVTSSRLKSDSERSSRFNSIIGYIEKPLTETKLFDCFVVNQGTN